MIDPPTGRGASQAVDEDSRHITLSRRGLTGPRSESIRDILAGRGTSSRREPQEPPGEPDESMIGGPNGLLTTESITNPILWMVACAFSSCVCYRKLECVEVLGLCLE